MAEKKVRTRVQSKHDVEKNWASATFAPLPGEIIIYDKDKGVNGGTHEKPRIKVGDGSTTVGNLPFVVDREATDAAIAEVDATVQGAFKNVSVSGRVLTFTKVDGSTVTATTQDTDTNTKVTNTKANTTKAYVTGTTSASTNTGTQVFDTKVYLDTEEGTLVATKFKGKAMQDDEGDLISGKYEKQADATEKLNTAKSYTDTKTANMNKEAYLSWGGRSLDAVGPVAVAMSAEHSANRLAYLNPVALSFETSNNSGSSWTSLTVSNEDKTKLVTTSSSISVGTASTVTTGCRTRMTLTATTSSTTYVYTRPKKLLINVNTPHGLNVLIEYKTGVSGAAWQTLGTYKLSGWSGWNEIDISQLTTLGGGTTQTSNNWYLRFTFGNTSVLESYKSSRSSILGIRLFGDTCWTKTSNMGETGHLYSYDASQNATFPAKVKATGGFEGNLTGTATNATNATNAINATYATTAGSADDAAEAAHATEADYAEEAGHATTATTATSATSATKATKDASGNVITTTYATKSELDTIISSGTSDPTTSTPGKFYFKYLS